MAIIVRKYLELYRQHISRDIIGAHKLVCMMKHGQAGSILNGYSEIIYTCDDTFLSPRSHAFLLLLPSQ